MTLKHPLQNSTIEDKNEEIRGKCEEITQLETSLKNCRENCKEKTAEISTQSLQIDKLQNRFDGAQREIEEKLTQLTVKESEFAQCQETLQRTNAELDKRNKAIEVTSSLHYTAYSRRSFKVECKHQTFFCFSSCNNAVCG